jgi:3-oxoacyl-[acyl-carrier-protein] synthase-3
LQPSFSRRRIVKPIKIIGTGTYLPPRIVTNDELSKSIETSDEWIRERTGIAQRRIAAEDQPTSDLCARAVRAACEDAGIEVDSIDALVVATSTADTLFPSTACWVQRALGIQGMAAFDVAAGCTGFVYALEVASSLVVAKTARRVAVVGGEVMSKVVNWKDRRTCVLFGDGAGAAIVEASSDERSGVLGSDWGANGDLAPILLQPAGGTRMPATHETVDAALHTVHMEGNKVFRHAVLAMSNSSLAAMKQAGVGAEEIDLLIPHQANKRIMESARERIGIPAERLHSIVANYGNMSAATVPVALHEAREAGRVKDGTTILLTAFGTGLTWGSAVLRW